MTDERDARLQALFAAAEEELADDGFPARVLAEIEAARKRRRRFLLPLGLAAASAALALSLPMLGTFGTLGAGLMEPLWPGLTRGGLAGFILAPVNSAGAVASFAFLAAHLAWRRLFG